MTAQFMWMSALNLVHKKLTDGATHGHLLVGTDANFLLLVCHIVVAKPVRWVTAMPVCPAPPVLPQASPAGPWNSISICLKEALKIRLIQHG